MAKTVLITGCSSGFGRAAARRFQAEGWNVVATMRDPARGLGLGVGERLVVQPLDVTSDASIQAALDATIARFDAIDVIVNNAGRGLFSAFETTPEEAIRSLLETNLFGPMKLIRAVLPWMREAGGGRIVNISSGTAIVAEPLMAAYTASKAALDAFTEALMFELSLNNIGVKLVVPGFVPTTDFVQSTQASSQNCAVPDIYQPYIDQRMAALMAAPSAPLATVDEVAAAIFAAAVDETGRLRWLVGSDNDERARMRWSAGEDAYAAWLGEQLAPRS